MKDWWYNNKIECFLGLAIGTSSSSSIVLQIWREKYKREQTSARRSLPRSPWIFPWSVRALDSQRVSFSWNRFASSLRRRSSIDYLCAGCNWHLAFEPQPPLGLIITCESIDSTRTHNHRQVHATLSRRMAWQLVECFPFLRELGTDKRHREKSYRSTGLCKLNLSRTNALEAESVSRSSITFSNYSQPNAQRLPSAATVRPDSA